MWSRSLHFETSVRPITFLIIIITSKRAGSLISHFCFYLLADFCSLVEVYLSNKAVVKEILKCKKTHKMEDIQNSINAVVSAGKDLIAVKNQIARTEEALAQALNSLMVFRTNHVSVNY